MSIKQSCEPTCPRLKETTDYSDHPGDYVENRLFRVPRQALESQSKIFRDMFSLPVAGAAEGSSDDNPIRLDGVTKEEFKRFLEVLFNMRTCKEATTQRSIFEMWFPVVKLAHLWEFDAIHKSAIKNMPYRQIDKIPAEKVGLAVHYEIRPWLLPGLNELAQRKEPLGNGDLAFLGPELTLKVAAVRESLRITSCGCYDEPNLISGPREASTVDFTPVIRHMFGLSEMITTSMLLDDDISTSNEMGKDRVLKRVWRQKIR